MTLGLSTWKDILEVIVIPISLAIIALLWPLIQSYYRRKAFIGLIRRELQEIIPYPKDFAAGKKSWVEHLQKEFIHQKIFEQPSENRDFILSLPPDLVYFVSQLWDAKKNKDGVQWLHFLEMISKSKYGRHSKIQDALRCWEILIVDYKKATT